MTRVLVLRPEPGASATVGRARERGLDAVAVPLFRVEPVEWRAPDPAAFDGLLLTSANAVRHGGDQLQSLRGLKAHAVGEATAEAARDAGFDIAATGEAGVDRLLGSIEDELRLLHLCGADRRQAQDARQAITPLVVYRSEPIESPDLSAAPGSLALVHSPGAGTRFAELIEERASIAIAAISDAAANAVGTGWKSIDVVERPSDDALLALAARLCNNPQPK
ncbi:MAG TPA: uroporphyrinogen-III synthase [Sphingomicrobium sp.]|nr:uroporphyrinogen-III synthase [Sphingomicrobium sp.]